ncbi:hypothetical protein XAB3213_1270013 [Xanthomonas citri pv. bilvae]|nr:hypothetical protein XAB3213_1270013 [Xanthomonas citri pv. bilvae]
MAAGIRDWQKCFACLKPAQSRYSGTYIDTGVAVPAAERQRATRAALLPLGKHGAQSGGGEVCSARILSTT